MKAEVGCGEDTINEEEEEEDEEVRPPTIASEPAWVDLMGKEAEVSSLRSATEGVGPSQGVLGPSQEVLGLPPSRVGEGIPQGPVLVDYPTRIL